MNVPDIETDAIKSTNTAIRGATVENARRLVGVCPATWYAWADYGRTEHPGPRRLEEIADWLKDQSEIFAQAETFVRLAAASARPVKRGRPYSVPQGTEVKNG